MSYCIIVKQLLYVDNIFFRPNLNDPRNLKKYRVEELILYYQM